MTLPPPAQATDDSDTATSPVERARQVLLDECEAIRLLAGRIGPEFGKAIELIEASAGRAVLTGMGKHGLVARKIAATLASTGTPSLFLHPAEGRHGDLGMVSPDDVVVALSYSGETDELLGCLGFLHGNGNRIVAITGNPGSTLARAAEVVLDASVAREACSLNLAPTTSTTVAMALGDALAVALLDRRRFTSEEFARRHPAGALGRRLLRVGELARQRNLPNPVVAATATFGEAVEAITAGGRGAVSVVDPAGGRLIGVFTDGDMRRALMASDKAGHTVAQARATPVAEVMSRSPRTIGPETFAFEALEMMESGERKVLVLPVVNEAGQPTAMVQIHDLVGVGL